MASNFEEKLAAEKDATEMMSINALPPELLVRIFENCVQTEGPREFVKNVSVVCMRWKNLSATPSLWDEVTLKSLRWNFDHLMKIAERGLLSATRYLNLSIHNGMDRELFNRCYKLKPLDFIKIAGYCPKLKSIDVSGGRMSKTAMEYLTVNCPCVEELSMGFMDFVESDIDPDDSMMPMQVFDAMFSGWGQKLKHLDLHICFSHDDELISKVAGCHSLEVLYLTADCTGNDTYFRCPIGKLQSGCPKLRMLQLGFSHVVFQGDEEFAGFSELRVFLAVMCHFDDGIDWSLLLRNSTQLESLEIGGNHYGMVNLSEIPSEKLKVLYIDYEDGSMEHVVKAMWKWRHTLEVICIDYSYGQDLACVLEAFLEDNPNPKLWRLCLYDSAMPMPLLKRLIRVCRNLSFLALKGQWNKNSSILFRNRQEIEEILSANESYLECKRKKE